MLFVAFNGQCILINEFASNHSYLSQLKIFCCCFFLFYCCFLLIIIIEVHKLPNIPISGLVCSTSHICSLQTS